MSSDENRRLWEPIDKALTDGLLGHITAALECSVCSEIMLVPFLTACGHSFCYDCLKSWFDNKLNCPTCRTDVETSPVLNVQLREIAQQVHRIMSETAAGPEAERLARWHAASTQAYTDDSAAQDLFGDLFKSALTLIDKSDGVPRCGNCHWEAHGSVCLHCGVRFRISRDDDYYDSADAYDEDSDEERRYGHEDGYDTGDSFLDGRDLVEINADTAEGDILSDSESWRGFDGSDSGEDLFQALHNFHRRNLGSSEEDDDDDENEHSDGRRMPIVINVSDEEV